MKKFVCLTLAFIMLLSCMTWFAGFSLTADAEENSGVETISFSKGGAGGNPYMSGLNNPVGYAFTLDSEKKLLSITINDFATYSNNVNKGTFRLYEWKGNRADTVSAQPLYATEIVNHQDHSDLVMNIPSELKLTGKLYFEVICTEGTSYTPWPAANGAADPIPGKVTDMQAYLDGNPSGAFVCEITIADMKDKSAGAHATFVYDFSVETDDVISKFNITQQNDISISDSENGYVTFTATGSDPYFKFSDAASPDVSADKLAYAVIKYRTSSDISMGEFYTNRSGGAQWGAEGTHVLWNYQNDGEWHTVVADAHNVWGNAPDETLYAFRFDPLASGCEAGDSIDVEYIKFFGEAVYANSYSASENLKLEEQRRQELIEGSYIADFGTGKTPAGLSAQSDKVTVFREADFHRFLVMSDNSMAETEINDIDKSSDFRYVKIAYRGQTGSEKLVVSAKGTGNFASVDIDINADGYWHEAIALLPVADGSSIDSLSFYLAGSGIKSDDWIDITYIGLFSEMKYAERFDYGTRFNTHRYALSTVNVPVLNVTGDEQGDPFCGGGESYGQKFKAESPVTGITVYYHATWGAETNEGYFRLWKWNGTYAQTTSKTPLVEQKLKDLSDGEDLTVTFDELPAGEYCFEVKMTSPSDKAYTGFTSKNGTEREGVISFRNGKENSAALVAAYLTKGVGLEDKGPEYDTACTFEYDFTGLCESAFETFGISCHSGASIKDLCDKGYLSASASDENSYITFGILPDVNSSFADNIVIKYRTNSSLQSGLSVERSDGVMWQDDGYTPDVPINWENDGEWHIAIVDATEAWGNTDDVKLENIRLDLFADAQTDAEIDIAYIKFFANPAAAKAFAQTETYIKDGKEYAVAPTLPLDPESITPVILIDGEKLNISDGVQCENTSYSYEDGYISLTATGSDPYYYLFKEQTAVAPYMAVKYRTSVPNVMGELYAGSVQSTAYGGGDYAKIDYIADGNWHVAVIDLSGISDYNRDTNKINYLRYDFIAPQKNALPTGAGIDIEYIAFFDTADEAKQYEHELPKIRETYEITFMVFGREVYKITYTEGDRSIDEPVVPIIPGMEGVWEPYEINDTNFTVNAVYTSTVVETDPAPAPDKEEESTIVGDETVSEEPTDDRSESEDNNAENKGCKSAYTVNAALLVFAVLSGSATAIKKKRGDS